MVIVGGGIAGLSTAWYLQKQAEEEGLDLHYTVLEQSDRWGGKILTERVDGAGDQPFIVEGGPDSFLTQKPWALHLARELGLGDQVLGTNDEKRKVFVLIKGKPTPLPDGVLMIVPTKFMPFALSPLISLWGKMRMGLDLFIPAKRDGQDETLADFITRRLGQEALDKIAEPLMSGIYNAEAERQSLLATFPRFRTLEEKHGSLIKGMLAARKMRGKGSRTSDSRTRGSRTTGSETRGSRTRGLGANGSGPSTNDRPKVSMFVSLQNGTEELVRSLIDKLSGDLRLETAVTGLQKVDDHYQVVLENGDNLVANAVVLAVPAYISARLVDGLTPVAAVGLRGIRYVSTGTISLAFRREDVELLEGFGLVIPRSEGRSINAVTLTSTKFDNRAPAGHVLIRVFFGGSRSPQMMELDDEQLVTEVLSELKALMGIKARPLFQRIFRWHHANPQYDVGHLERVEAIESFLPEGLYITGSPYRGIGLPDCVHQGQQTAEKVAQNLNPKLGRQTGSVEKEVQQELSL